ncbi:hydantoinase B/oxoprolinase family protein [Bosea sp. (in: a-proteobacteria)]|uniref:hydantoinase B/oxoprolinase family protein n=1 Tax=Bosea sp. (in: a-proteobacteria) TaxID=1871050 RepID=UPI0025B7A8C6|nr:hydantoinase B/oxoprolinase family protein [Bosea sp. (in: a-proteobacteria)]
MTSPVAASRRTLDPIDLAIAWDRLISITDEGAAALIRTSFSMLVREGFDLSVMIFDTRGRLIAQSRKCIPVFIGTAPVTMAHMLKRFPPQTLAPGDVVASNDPVIGTGHMFDLALMKPIFRGGRIVAYAMSITHLPDIGGMGFSAAATEIYHEGLRLPIWKLFAAGQRDETLIELIKLNVRVPEQVLGDIMASVSCLEVVDRQLGEFLSEAGLADVDQLAVSIIDQTEAAVRSALVAIPDGAYRNEVEVEAFGDIRRLVCRIDKRGSEASIDFAGTGPCVGAGINVPLSYTRSMALYTLKCITAPRLPNNDGATVPISISAPVGCLLNAVPPAPSAGRHVIGHFIPPLIFGALAEVVPDRVMAGSGLIDFITLQGRRPDGSGMATTFCAAGGFGALSDLDGQPTTPGSSNMGGMSAELFEPESGLVVERKSLRPDSGGAGAYRGGPGQEIVLRNDSGFPVSVFSMANRTQFPAQGFAGGQPGACRQHLVNGETISPQGRHELAPGDRLTLREAGGAGFGNPQARPASKITDDLRRGYATPEGAARAYGPDWPRRGT